MKLMCRDCYIKTHSVPQGYKCEMSNEKYRCTVCGKNKFIVVNIYNESLLLNFKKVLYPDCLIYYILLSSTAFDTIRKKLQKS